MSTETPPPVPGISLEWLNIEFSSRCNLRCKWCSLDFDKASVHMDEAASGEGAGRTVFRPGWAVGEIALHNGGETLLHPRLTSMLAVIAARRAGHTSFPSSLS